MKVGKREITKAYDLWMKGHGFNKINDRPNSPDFKYYSKELINDRLLLIRFDIYKENGQWLPPQRLEGWIYFNRLDNIIAKYLKPETTYVYPIKGYSLNLSTPFNTKLKINLNSVDDINTSLELIEEHYQDFIIPFENHFQDIESLYHYVEDLWRKDALNAWFTMFNAKLPIIRLVYKALLRSPDFYSHAEEIPKYLEHLKEIGREAPLNSIKEVYPEIMDELTEIYEDENRTRNEFVFIPSVVFYTNEERARQRMGLITVEQREKLNEIGSLYSKHWEQGRPMKDGLPMCMYNMIYNKQNKFDQVGCKKLNEE